jgi:sporulation-control protein
VNVDRGVTMLEGPTADTVLDKPVACPGDVVTGRVRLQGCAKDVVVDRLVVGVSARGHYVNERKGRVLEYSLPVLPGADVRWTVPLDAGQRLEVPFALTLPLSTPITAVGNATLPVTVGVWTQVWVAKAWDPSDHDQLLIQPLPAQSHVLDAFGALGCVFVSADLYNGLPLLEFSPPWQHQAALVKMGLALDTDERKVTVHVTASRRRRVFRPRIDVATVVRVRHEDAAGIDWVSWLGGWVASVAR